MKRNIINSITNKAEKNSNYDIDSLRQFYSERIDLLSADIVHLNRYSRLVIFLELATIILAILCVVGYASWGGGIISLAMAAVLFASYIFIRVKDVHNNSLAEQKENIRMVYQKEVSYLNGDFSCFPSGEQYINPHHEFTFDLDIFGPQSLFNRINRTVTSGGSDYLANELAETRQRTISEIKARRECIRELSDREELRTQYLATSQRHTIDTAKILTVLHNIQQMPIPKFPLSLFSLIVICSSIFVFYAMIILAFLDYLNPEIPMIWAAFQCSFVYLLCSRSLRYTTKAVQQIHRQISTYINLIVQILDSGLTSDESRSIISRLSNGQTDAVKSLHQLHSILNSLDRRTGLWVFLSNTFFCGDYFIVRKFLRWQECNIMYVEDWIDAVSHFDALVSMATFCHNEPTATNAELVEADGVIFEAQGLYHPFLGEKAVRNDFSITDNHYYIVTGANMAGKSTFLRSIGINYVLAICGMPVFADTLRISLFSLFSSMRTTDNLAQGISYFNAELLRLQQLIETCQRNDHTLIILDEILKGTNSLDKLNGSRLFLQSVATLPITGIIATHDLELSKMQQNYPERFHNYCFEIQLSDEIVYTYKLSEGIAQNQNATYLLKNILKTTLQ